MGVPGISEEATIAAVRDQAAHRRLYPERLPTLATANLNWIRESMWGRVSFHKEKGRTLEVVRPKERRNVERNEEKP